MAPKAGGAGTTTITVSDDDDDEGVEGTEEQEQGQDEGGEDEEFDKDRALSTIKAQRDSEKKLKKELSDLRAELKQIKDKDLPDAERQTQAMKEAEERAEKAERALQRQTLRTTALEEATALGFRNPALAHRLIDADEVEYDGDQPTNIKSLLKALLREDPYLKGRRGSSAEGDDDDDADAGAGRGRRGAAFSMNDEIRRQAGRA